MTNKKFRKRGIPWLGLIKKTVIPIKPNKQVKKAKPEECKHSFLLLDEDRISYLYKYLHSKDKRNIVEITCVSYDIFVANSWKTIIYYDDTHDGILHRHEIISIDDKKGKVITAGVKQKGGRKKLLDWAIKDLTKNYSFYKKEFLKRNNDLLT